MSTSLECRTLASLDDVTVRLRDFHLLHNTTWTICRGQQWVVLGPNGSGKSALVRALAGDVPTSSGRRRVSTDTRIEVVSFESQQALIAGELELDHARFYAGRPDDGVTPRDLFANARPDTLSRYTALFDFDHLLDRPFRVLSAGEMRMAVIIRALLKGPDLLVLDEPYDGLDAEARDRLSRQINTVAETGTNLVLVTHRLEEIPAAATHALTIQDLVVQRIGPVAEVLTDDHVAALYRVNNRRANKNRTHERHVDIGPPAIENRDNTTGTERSPRTPRTPRTPIVAFRAVTLGGTATPGGTETPLLKDFSWSIYGGEHWSVTGPNGSGKTTLINLISGEDLRAYAVDLTLFGRRRGTGESLWEIRNRIGLVTPKLQLTYSPSTTVLETVISGYFGSVGLYRRPTPEQITQSRYALELLGLSTLEDRLISRVSNGQRRLALIARALVREPELLLLDEPCQGLDPSNRSLIVESIDHICRRGKSTVVYITHHADEIPESITNRLHLPGDGRFVTT